MIPCAECDELKVAAWVEAAETPHRFIARNRLAFHHILAHETWTNDGNV